MAPGKTAGICKNSLKAACQNKHKMLKILIYYESNTFQFFFTVLKFQSATKPVKKVFVTIGSLHLDIVHK